MKILLPSAPAFKRTFKRGAPLVLPVALSALALLPNAVWADERSDLEQVRATTMALLQALVEGGLISRDKADAIVKQAQQAKLNVTRAAAVAASASPAAAASAPPVVRVPYISETVKAELRQQVKDEVLAQAKAERWAEPNVLPEWFSRVNLEGDVRVRMELDGFAKSNLPADIYALQKTTGNSPAWSPDLTNTTHDRTRMTLRARLGISGKLSDEVSTGLRLATGSLTNGATSTSQTLGSGLNRYTLGVDRAWISWKPVNELKLDLGRVANPFFSSDLTWPDDLNFDGAAATYKRAIGPANSAFATVGAFPLQEFSVGSSANKWLYGAQLGGQFWLAPLTEFKLGLAAYNFNNIEGVQEPVTKTGALKDTSPYLSSEYPSSWRQKGNTLINIAPTDVLNTPAYGLASKFKPVDVSMLATFHQFDPVTVQLWLDYVKNTGFDLADLRNRAGDQSLNVEAKTSALQARVNVGRTSISKAGDWMAFAAWRRLERDAWVDAFTDTTWNLGGTNYMGWSLGGQYGVAPRTSVGLRWTSTRNLKDQTINTPTAVDLSSTPLKLDVWQLELNSRF